MRSRQVAQPTFQAKIPQFSAAGTIYRSKAIYHLVAHSHGLPIRITGTSARAKVSPSQTPFRAVRSISVPSPTPIAAADVTFDLGACQGTCFEAFRTCMVVGDGLEYCRGQFAVCINWCNECQRSLCRQFMRCA